MLKKLTKLWKDNPKLSVGLHLNLTVGYPLCRNLRTLTNEDGTFNKQVLKAKPQDIDIEEMRLECQSQMDKFIEMTGKLPDHINSHHGIEAIPGGSIVLQELAKKYDLPIRQLTYIPKSETIEYTTNYEIPLMRALTDSSAGPKGVVDLFTNEDLKGEGFFEWLGHPGYVDWNLMQLSSLTLGRCLDAHCFCSPAIKEWIKRK